MIRVYNIAILVLAAAFVACTTTTVDEEEGGGDDERTTTGTPSAVVEWMDDILSYYYLYNDEYNSMSIDYDMDYDDFLDYHLLNMTTNVLDRKYNSSTGSYEIYSYIDQYSSSVSMSRSLNSTEDGLGIVNLVISDYGNNLCFGVLGVYPDSPAYNAGIRRGDIITSVSNRSITASNYETYAKNLLYPTVGTSYTIGLYGQQGNTKITAAVIEPNPVLHSEIIDDNIGYLVYSQFNSNFDTELLAALSDMSSVTNLILDLRLNGGGYNSSAVKLGSAIRGSTSTKQVFAEYVYNSNLAGKYTQYAYFDSSYAKLNLPNKKIYCLVSEQTASASELVISALMGIGYEIVLIGDTTEGKNVGMFVHDDTIDGYYYVFAPITFISKNAKEFYEYQNGFAPDYSVNEYSGFADFGKDEPLVATALNLIDSETYPAVSVSRSAETFTPIEIIERRYPRGVLRRAE